MPSNVSIDNGRLVRFGNLEFLARQIVEGFIVGLHKSPFHGFSVEFAEHRLYNTGEPIRHIDWKLYGRTEKLFVKRYEEETNLRCQIVIDNSSSMLFPVRQNVGLDNPNKLIYSVYAAASLMELMRRQRDAVGLDLFNTNIEFHSEPRMSEANKVLLYSKLEGLLAEYDKNNAKTTSVPQCLHSIAEMLHRRSLVLLFSDMLYSQNDAKPVFEALEHLRYNRHEVVMFHVFSGSLEQNLEYGNTVRNFIDLESGASVKLNPVEVKEAYQKIMAEKKKEIMQHCYNNCVDYVELDIDKGYEQALTAYLVKREKIR